MPSQLVGSLMLSAFAVLNLDKGRVNSEKSDDIYGLDGKFSKVLVPPEPIKNYLNEKIYDDGTNLFFNNIQVN